MAEPIKGTTMETVGKLLSPEAFFASENGIWQFPKIRGTLFWGPYNKDPTPTIQGTILRSPNFGNSHIDLQVQAMIWARVATPVITEAHS